MNKFVIVAPRKTGKTTLVKNLLENTSKSVCGFQTSRLTNAANEDGLYPLYIYPVLKEMIVDEKHCLGYCGKGKHIVNSDVFNDMAVKLITPSNKDELIIIDELGFMESDAITFKNKVFEILELPNSVLIMCKDKPGIKFLEDIKSSKNVELITMNIQNRDEVFTYIKEKLA